MSRVAGDLTQKLSAENLATEHACDPDQACSQQAERTRFRSSYSLAAANVSDAICQLARSREDRLRSVSGDSHSVGDHTRNLTG